MILITGGSGFIGSHVVRALADRGVASVLLQRRSADVPQHLTDLPVAAAAEQADVADLDALRAIARRHPLTGIVHLAGYPAPGDPVDGVTSTERLTHGLANVVRVAAEHDLRRVTVASTIGVYGGLRHEGPLTEDLPVRLSAPHPIPRWKKITELLTEQFAEATGVELVNLRISGTWGPRGHDDPFFAAPALVHAAARRRPLDLSALAAPPHLGDGLDLCYVKDTGRAIALLQLTDGLRHRTYNVASGRVTTNAEIVDALRPLAPDADLTLPAGDGHAMNPLSIDRLRADTGFAPEYDTARAAADYVAWLRAGHER